MRLTRFAETIAICTALTACAPAAQDDPGTSASALLTDAAPCWVGGLGVGLRLRDDESRAVALPFAFPFFDRTYEQLWVNANGNVTLNRANTEYAKTTIPSGTLAIIAPAYGDFNPAAADGLGPASDVFVQVVGDAPYRALVVTWAQLVPSWWPTPSDFQLVLSETGNITFAYGAIGVPGFIDGRKMYAGFASGAGESWILAAGSQLPSLAYTSTRFARTKGGAYSLASSCEAFSGPPAPVYVNTPPVANAGADQVVECTGSGRAQVALDGSGSSDADADSLSFAWVSDGVSLGDTPVIAPAFTLGTHEVTLTVTDGAASASDSVNVVVQDTTAPGLSFVQDASVVWPPDGRMQKVLSQVAATDGCCIASVKISVSGDPADSAVVESGKGVYDVYVRATRKGYERDGRRYDIRLTATDCAGNAREEKRSAFVPHDQRK